MAKIRILLVLEATTGGTRRYITQVLTHIDLGKFEPVLFCAVERDQSFLQDLELFRKRGVKVRIFPMKREIVLLQDMLLVFEMAREIRKEKPDIVHTHSSKAGIIGRAAARLAGVARIAHTPHVFPFEMDVGGFRRWFYLLLERIAAKWTKLLIAVSRSERDIALKKGLFKEDSSVVIPNGIEPELWHVPEPSERERQRRLGRIDEPAFVVGMVGRFMPQKGHRILVQAAEILLKRKKNISFVLVGDGELKDDIWDMTFRSGADRNFLFMGQTDSIASCYAMFDCLVMPSLWESCPFTAMEAMAMEIPVVASAVGGVTEIIEDGVSGMLVPPADAHALADAIGKLCEDRSLRMDLARNGRQRVMEKFQLPESMSRLEETYQRMAH